MPGDWVDLPGKGVRKRVIRQGQGAAVGSNPDGPVTVHYTGRLNDGSGEIFDSSVGGEAYTFRIGAGEVIAGCEDGVATMAVGEKAQFLIESHRAYGAEGSPPEVPPNTPLHFEIELIRNTPLPRVLLAHDSDVAFAMDGGVADASVAAGLFDDAGAAGAGGGMYDDAPEDGSAGMFADADDDVDTARAPALKAPTSRPRLPPNNIFAQLAGGGEDNDLGVERNGVVTFNIAAELQNEEDSAEPIPDVQDDSLFPTLGSQKTPANPGWPRKPPAPTQVSAAVANSTSVGGAAKPVSEPRSNFSSSAREDTAAMAEPTASLGIGGTDGSPFPERCGDEQFSTTEEEEEGGERPPSDVLVVDTAGFLRNAPLEKLGREIYTIPEVISEIRDRAVRERMAGVLPYELKFREPTPRSLGIVSDFARQTGDFHGLSVVDLKVLALAHTLTVERNGEGSINVKPIISIRDAPKNTSRHGWFLPEETAGDTGDTSTNSTTDALPTTEPSTQPGPEGDEATNPADAATKAAAAAAAAWGGDWDNEKSEDDRGWITPSNLKAVVKTLGRKENHIKATVRVGCVTADFSMQNVLLQMGMNVVSVDGLLIRRVKTFSLKCETCFRVSHEVHRKFCRHCGHPTLYKITVTTNADGKIEYRMPRRIRTSNRGARYTAPAPKMGRVNNLLVREDQREFTRPQRREKSFDAFTADHVAGDSPFKHTDHSTNTKKGNKVGPSMTGRMVIGGGRNPNAVRKRTGNKKKK